MLRLEALGGLVVLDEAGVERSTPRRRLALLALLATPGKRGATRDRLMAYLWPESAAENARHGLEQLVYESRRHLGDALFVGTDPLRLNPEAITSDVAEFEAAIAGGALAAATALYHGPFLDGFFLSEAPEFERWAESERTRLAQAFGQAVYGLAREDGDQGRHTAAIGWWRTLSAAEPLSGRAALGLARELAAAGDRAGALQSARAYETLVRDELQSDLDPGVSDLIRQLESPRPGVGAMPVGGAAASPASGVRPTRRPAPQGFDATLADRYVVEGVVREGGMATIYRARDLRHDRPVAIKVLKPEIARAMGVERFLREIEVASRLQHPLILPVFDSGATGTEAAPTLWFAMPLIEGDSLRERIGREGQLPVDEAVSIGCDLAEALGYAHAQGVVHRDVKPENVLFSGGHAILSDFGIARALTSADNDRLTAIGVSIGTPAYMSPEQAGSEGRLDGRSDLYGLGCVMYEMLAGQPPFVASTVAGVLARHATDPVPSLRTVRPAVPVALEQAIQRALAKVPADRFATSAEFAAALRRGLQPGNMRRSLRPVLLAAGAIGVVAVGLLVGLRARNRGTLDPHRVVVTAFVNRTGDAALKDLGQYTADELSRGLALTGVLEIADPGSLVLSDRGPAASEVADAEAASALAGASGSALVVWGSIYRRGARFELSARITDARGRRELASPEPVVGDPADPRPAVAALRERIMATLAQAADARLSDAALVAGQPPRYDAYMAFADGIRLWWVEFNPVGLQYLLRASALDSAYALPLIYAAWNYELRGVCDSTELLARRLAGMSLTRLEEPQIEREIAFCRGDFQGAYRAARRLADALPASEVIQQQLVREVEVLGRPTEALAILGRLHPDRGALRDRKPYYRYTADAYHSLGDHIRELQVAEDARAKFGRRGTLRMELVALAALDRTREIENRLDAIAPFPAVPFGYPPTIIRETALELAAHGHSADAPAVLHRALAWLDSRPPVEQATDSLRFERAQVLYDAGLFDSSRAIVARLAGERPGNDNYTGLLAVLAAVRGDRAEARRLDTALARLERPRGPAAFWRACVAARLGERDEAVGDLARAQAQGFVLFVASYPPNMHVLGPHVEPSFATLRGYPPFEELMRPKG